MRIRDARKSDGPRVLEFMQRYFPEEESIMGTRPEGFSKVVARIYRWDARLALGLLRLVRRPVFRLLVAEEDGRLAATTLLTFNGPTGYLSMVVVDPAYRRRGFARALLERARSIAQRAGKTYVALEVLSANAPAIELYENLGYRRLASSAFEVHASARTFGDAPEPASPAIRPFRKDDASAIAAIARARNPPEYERVMPTRAEAIRGSPFAERVLQGESAAWVVDRGRGPEAWVSASCSPATEAAQMAAPITAPALEPELGLTLVRTAGTWIASRRSGRIMSVVPEVNAAGRAALEAGGFHEAISAFLLYRSTA
jgi:ribosomal protein S18 acetylase RimI-like enzyme